MPCIAGVFIFAVLSTVATLLSSSGAAVELPGPADRGEWNTLHEGKVTVTCGAYADSSWCHAEAILPARREAVHALLVDVERISELFPRMKSMRQVQPGVMHQILDYPFPYDDRDIVAHFEWTCTPDLDALQWASVSEPVVPTVGVRLTGAAGRFELRDGPTSSTTVLAYTWRAELGPGIPDWVRPYAWRAQANEVVDGLEQGLSRTAATTDGTRSSGASGG